MTKSTGTRRRWTKEVDDQIEALVREGVPPRDVASRLDVPLHKVQKVQQKRGVKYDAAARSAMARVVRAQQVPEYPADLTTKILGLRAQGVKRREIAVQLGVSFDKVQSDIQSHLRKHPEQRLGAAIRSSVQDRGAAARRHQERRDRAAARQAARQADRDAVADKIAGLREQGVQLRAIAAEVGCGLFKVKQVLRRRGVRLPAVDYAARLAAAAAAAGDKVLDEYAGSDVKLGFRCQAGHFFRMAPNTYEAGHRCRACYVASRTGVPNPRMSKHRWAQFLAAIERARFQLVGEAPDPAAFVVGASNENGRYRLRCHCGNVWSPSLHDVLYGKYNSCGCVKSQAPLDIRALLESWGEVVVMNDREIIAPHEVDVWLPERRLGIEYNGLHWHGEVVNGAAARTKHWRKHVAARAADIQLIQVFEDEWVHDRDKVVAVLRARLGHNERRLGARECVVAEVKADEAQAFLDRHHLRGYGAGGTHLGLRLGDELLAMVTVRPPAASRVPDGYSKAETLDITRFCVAGGVTVSGGFSRLLAGITKRFSGVRCVVTYSDNRWSEGGLYEAVGFRRDRESGPSYSYHRRGTQGPRRPRFQYRLKNIKRMWPDETGTEWEIMRRHGWDRTWDCGTTRWVWSAI